MMQDGLDLDVGQSPDRRLLPGLGPPGTQAVDRLQRSRDEFARNLKGLRMLWADPPGGQALSAPAPSVRGSANYLSPSVERTPAA